MQWVSSARRDRRQRAKGQHLPSLGQQQVTTVLLTSGSAWQTGPAVRPTHLCSDESSSSLKRMVVHCPRSPSLGQKRITCGPDAMAQGDDKSLNDLGKPENLVFYPLGTKWKNFTSPVVTFPLTCRFLMSTLFAVSQKQQLAFSSSDHCLDARLSSEVAPAGGPLYRK